MSIAALQLRCLIANDEMLVRHLADQLEGEDGGDGADARVVVDALPTPAGYAPEREALLQKLGDAIRRLQRRRAALQALSPSHGLQSLIQPSPAVADARALNGAQPALSSL